MKKQLIFLLAGTLSFSTVYGSESTAACSGDLESADIKAHCLPINCSSIQDILEFTRSHEERPVITGAISRDRRMVLFLNSETGSWTLIGHNNDRACIFSYGNEVRNLLSPNRTLK